MTAKGQQQWEFTEENRTFFLRDPQLTSSLYFPLVNEAGMKSAVTPLLHGAVKIDHDTYLTEPLSVVDLHNTRSARNFWVYMAGKGPWSVTGNSAAQIAERFSGDSETVSLEAGMLWHTVKRENLTWELQAEVTNFIPENDDQVELMRISLTNVGKKPCTLTPTAALPIYARSAENLRDHRHVTSLFHRVRCTRAGVLVKPTMHFDERGHLPNHTCYAVLGWDGKGHPPLGFFPVVEDFIGEGGNLDWPLSIVLNESPADVSGSSRSGREALGGLRFPTIKLGPGEKQSWVLALAITDQPQSLQSFQDKYGSEHKFQAWLERTKKSWDERVGNLQVKMGDKTFNAWIQWVSLQPILRHFFGNSFLPYHDYGRGGRGWRDLWQDILPLLLTDPDSVLDLLLTNFTGVRLDGSNATIIGHKAGEFRADRNKIPRVWMDHGAWPLHAVKLYLDQTGELDFLLQEVPYFKDHLMHRAQAVDHQWVPHDGTRLKTANGEICQGSVLEHLLVQHLTAFFHVGEHNNIKLENADWNDGLDMAPDHGESVAFTAFYAGNLDILASLVEEINCLGVTDIPLFVELFPLLDRISSPVDYSSWRDKRDRLEEYFSSVERTVSGDRDRIPLQALADDLRAKSSHLVEHLRAHEWVQDNEGYGWYNGYYDNQGERLEGPHPQGTRMTLTGQVFQIMSGVATDRQVQDIVRAVNHHLVDDRVGGIRLNTDFGDYGMENLGRAFGFAYGHKENGAMFNHMSIMYANALYQRGLVEEGHRILEFVYQQSVHFQSSRMYPGIPEYFDPSGRGMYPYLTGSASWYLLTLVREVFGVQGHKGDLLLHPNLVKSQFNDKGRARLLTKFAARKLEITYQNPVYLDWHEYIIGKLTCNGKPLRCLTLDGKKALVERSVITALDPDRVHTLEIELVPS